MDLDATVRAQLEAAAASQDVAVEDKRAKAEKIIWAAVALSGGMGAVPFGINFGFFLAVSGGLVVCLGELYGYIYTKREAAALVVQIFKSCNWTLTASTFGLKFMSEVLKVSGVVTAGVATPAGMALDAVLCGAVTYAVGFTTLRYLEQNRELPAEAMRTEFRTRFAEGVVILREQARQRSAELGTELSTEVRARYDTAARQLKENADVLREQARQRGTVLGAEVRARYDTAARQLKENADVLREQARQRGTVLGAEVRARYDTAARQLKENADVLREQARQRGTVLGAELRARYDSAARQLKKKKS